MSTQQARLTNKTNVPITLQAVTACSGPTSHSTCAVFAMATTRAWVATVNRTQARHWTSAVSAVATASRASAAMVCCSRTKLSTVVTCALVTTLLAVAAITFLIRVSLRYCRHGLILMVYGNSY